MINICHIPLVYATVFKIISLNTYVLPPLNSYAEIQMNNVTVLIGGAFGKCLRHGDGTVMCEIFNKELPERSEAPWSSQVGLKKPPAVLSLGQPTPVFLPGKPHGQRSLAGCSWQCCGVRHDWSYLAHRHDHMRAQRRGVWCEPGRGPPLRAHAIALVLDFPAYRTVTSEFLSSWYFVIAVKGTKTVFIKV